MERTKPKLGDWEGGEGGGNYKGVQGRVLGGRKGRGEEALGEVRVLGGGRGRERGGDGGEMKL